MRSGVPVLLSQSKVYAVYYTACVACHNWVEERVYYNGKPQNDGDDFL